MKSLNTTSKALLQEVFHLERSGRYNNAIQLLDEIWFDKSSFPDVEEFDNFDAANIILRCGSLIGFLGHNEQLSNSQEKSKNLLTEARKRFLDIYNLEKVAECENYLALGYWRAGELVEADVWVEEALSRDLPKSSFVRCYSIIIKSGNLLSNNKYDELLQLLDNEKEACLEFGDECLIGDYYNFYALALKNVGKELEAIDYLELAKFHHQKSGHQIYLGTVENNLARAYQLCKRFGKAHLSIDGSIKIFKDIKADIRYGFALDTKALIYLDQGELQNALETVEQSISILRKGENADFLVETLSSKVKILVSSNKIAEASLCLAEAINIANQNIGEKKAQKLAEDFEKSINNTKTPIITGIYTEKELENKDIKLVLPPEISNFNDIQGVWIKNNHLETTGLKNGALAIVADVEVKRGDLVAILERDSEDVLCGFYDEDFGIICLEIADQKPQLFSQDEIQILGRIIGVADNKDVKDNKMYVSPIETAR